MDIDAVIKKIIALPNEYNLGKKSIYALLKETSYFEMYDEVTEDMIRVALNKHPECINDWVMYSEDKRTSSGWFIKIENGKNIVGYFSSERGFNQTETEYLELAMACAIFIKYEIESIRT